MSEAIAAGCITIYLEKPGAPTVAELEAMKKEGGLLGSLVLLRIILLFYSLLLAVHDDMVGPRESIDSIDFSMNGVVDRNEM